MNVADHAAKLIAKKWLAGFLLLSLAVKVFADDTNELALIPWPQKIQRLDGAFPLTATTRIFSDFSSRKTAGLLAAQLNKSTGYPLETGLKLFSSSPVADAILLTTKNADASLGAEGYELTVTTNGVVIRAPTQAGLFYGVQTLLQLLPPKIFSTNVVAGFDWQIPAVQIRDWPRFKWRGFMLDVSRHFFTKTEVKNFLDAMALYKINTFHWHLTDDQGWRIEIKKYPKLTEIGAWRSSVGFGFPSNSSTAYAPDGRYGGFYTQADIREVVAYAADRHITIVPEIEMPGHSMAALAAYPQFSCTGGPFITPTNGGVLTGIYNPANAATFQFLDDVLTEVFQLFPGKYIHLGGDEVPKETWKKSAECQTLMQHEGLKNEEELQSWFIRRMEKFVNANGKTLIGWSEILQGGLAQNATVMDWIGGGKEAASAGHDVVMTPTDFCYFDYYQSQDTSLEPPAIGGFVPLKKVYAFEPVPASLAPEFQSHILGAQGNLWTEYVPNFRHAEYMAFPRLSALAEVTWSAPAARNFTDFTRRLHTDQPRLEQLGINYRPYRAELRVEIGEWEPAQIKNEMTPLEWDVTTNVTAAGKCQVSLDYTDGACGIDIAWVALLEDGQEISRDTHDGFTGSSPRKSTYTLDVPTPKPRAHYTLRAQVAGSGGTDSSGSVFWNFKTVSGQ